LDPNEKVRGKARKEIGRLEGNHDRKERRAHTKKELTPKVAMMEDARPSIICQVAAANGCSSFKYH
jgi:hypothetical protein